MKKSPKPRTARTKRTPPTRATRPQKVKVAESVKRSFHVHTAEDQIFREVARRTGLSINRAMAFLARAGWATVTRDTATIQATLANWQAQQKRHATEVAAAKQLHTARQGVPHAAAI